MFAAYIILGVLILIVRSITALCHELGHGLPALLLTDDNVTVYVGSYGVSDNHFRLKLGRFKIFLRYNPFFWHTGLCVFYVKEHSFLKQAIIVLMGPLATLIAGVCSFYFALIADLHGSIKLASFVFLCSTIIDFYVNIVPDNEPTMLASGKTVYNDGYQLKRLFKYRILPSQSAKGLEYYNNKEYANASEVFQEIIDKGLKSDIVYRFAILSHIQCKSFEKALDIHNNFKEFGELDSNDFSASGLMKSRLGQYFESLEDYNKSLELNPDNLISLSNRGYTYNLIHCYDKAIEDFNRVIELNPTDPYPYNNRGLARIKQGKTTQGLEDIQISLSIDESNSYAYRNLGIYHLEQGESKKALAYFNMAYNIDPETHLVSEYIEEASLKSKGE